LLQFVDKLATSLLRTHLADKLCDFYVYTRKNAQVVTGLQTSCYKSVHKLSTSCVRTACSQLTCYKVVLTSLMQSWYNKNVTKLTTQGCNNIVISWLYRTCWNNLGTNLIVSTRLLQVVNSLTNSTTWQLNSSTTTTAWQLNSLTTWDKQCEHNLLTACWQTCYKMWDFYFNR
jgi:hypothetical protein